MDGKRDIWLVRNEASGSNDDDALAALEGCCTNAGFRILRQICFPKDDLPVPAELDRAGIGLVAVFGGDGTANTLVDALAGWAAPSWSSRAER